MTTTNVAILQGYTSKFTVNLTNADGTPKDLTGATQITVAFPSKIIGLPAVLQNLVAALNTTGTLSSGSNQLTALASVAGIEPGQLITGTGIPANTYVQSIANGVVTMTQNATAGGSGVSVVFGSTNVAVSGAAGQGAIDVTLPASDSANCAPLATAQSLEVAVTNADGTKSGFVLPGFLSISAPPYGQV
jgi:hypothetical protein